MNRERDIRMKSTSVGPHRDDVCFMVGNLDIRRFGSQGQQRTAALVIETGRNRAGEKSDRRHTGSVT